MIEWKLRDTFLNIATNWVRLIGESYTDQDGKDIEYYRVEKTESVIVLPIYKDLIYCAPASFRPGVQRSTLDFPGGRIIENKSIKDSALAILGRELGVSAERIEDMQVMDSQGWPINSSFSNQKLFGVIAYMSSGLDDSSADTGGCFSINPEGISDLLARIDCAQCRLVLFHYLFLKYSYGL